ncbi:MAG: hypothetical protein MZV70_67535 [Desulfobacterales bacterium]|nr:hypothetical protein [Desulfobacterales bacterium]
MMPTKAATCLAEGVADCGDSLCGGHPDRQPGGHHPPGAPDPQGGAADRRRGHAADTRILLDEYEHRHASDEPLRPERGEKKRSAHGRGCNRGERCGLCLRCGNAGDLRSRLSSSSGRRLLRGIRVAPVPGASALIAALSVSGPAHGQLRVPRVSCPPKIGAGAGSC